MQNSPNGGSRDARGALNPRTFSDQVGELTNQMQDLRRSLQGAGATRQDLQAIDEVTRTLRSMAPGMASSNPKGLAELSATALDKLKKLEFDLRKRVDTTNDQLYLSGSEDIPAPYKGLASEYYRRLSKKGGGQ
jgi:hypothetical protein